MTDPGREATSRAAPDLGERLPHDVDARFAAHEVSLEGTTWRPILAINCPG